MRYRASAVGGTWLLIRGHYSAPPNLAPCDRAPLTIRTFCAGFEIVSETRALPSV
jgi:hypothetical protein